MRKSDYANARAKWRRWIKRIGTSVSGLVLDDYIFRHSMADASKGKRIGSDNEVYRFIMRAYATHAAISIRRLLDPDKRTYSLFHLVRCISKNPQVITRRSYVGRYSRANRHLGEADFDELAGPGSASFPQSVVQQDLGDLEAIQDKMFPVFNKFIAHRERSPRGFTRATWNELHKAIREIDRICVRYCLILNQLAMDTMLPSVSASRARTDVGRVWN